MKMQFVLAPIPEKFNPGKADGYTGRFINQKGLDGKAVIEEAIAMDYVPSYTPQQVKACAMGLMESMLAGVARDGNPRSVDGFIKVTPILKGRFPKEDSSYDPEVNSVVVKVQLLHELKPLDTKDWSFVNATPKPEPEPGPTLTTVNGGPAGTTVDAMSVTLGGTNLADATVKISYTNGSGEAVERSLTTESVTDTAIVLPNGWDTQASDIPDGEEVTFIATTEAGSAHIAAHYHA